MITEIKKSRVVSALQDGKQVFMIASELNPYVFPDARAYVNPEGCLNRVQVNQTALEYSVFGCINRNTGLKVKFFSEEV